MSKTAQSSRRGEVLRFAIPASVGMVLQNLFGLVDQLFVGSLGEPSFVAVGLTVQILVTAMVVLSALGVGAAIQLARHAGARDEAAFSATGAELLRAAAVGGVAAALGLMAGAERIFALIGVAPEVAARGVSFVRLVGWSLPLMVLIEAGNQVMRARGDTRTPMVIGLVSLGANSLLNFALIFGWGPLPKMGLAGVGLATLLSRCVGLAIVGWRIFSPRYALAVRPRDLARFEGARLASLLRLALPIAAGQGAWMLGGMGYTMVYAALGTSPLAAANAINPLEGVWLVFSYGFGVACLTLTGHELGRGDTEAAYALSADILRMAAGVSVVTGGLLAVSASQVGRLYPRLEAGTLALAAMGLVVSGALQPVKTLNMALASGVLRSGGDVRFLMGCEVLMAVGISASYGLGVALGYGYLGVLAGKACEEALKLGAFLWRYRSRRWIHSLAPAVS